MLFYIEDNGLGISVKGEMQTPGGNIARNLESFGNLLVRDGNGCDPDESGALVRRGAWITCAAGDGPALIHLTVPRLSSHSGPDNQKGYRTDAEIAADMARDPLPRLRKQLVPDVMTETSWSELESEVERDVARGLDGGALATGAGSRDDSSVRVRRADAPWRDPKR